MELDERNAGGQPGLGSLYATGGLVLIGWLAAAWGFWAIEPGTSLPIHFDAQGNPDGFTSKPVGLLLLPAFQLGLALLFGLLPDSRGKFPVLVASQTLLVVLQVVVVSYGLGNPLNHQLALALAVAAFCLVFGNYSSTLSRNWLVGIRTPWTLRSDEVWERTHRLGGRVFVGLGVAVLFTVLGSTELAYAVALWGSVGAALATFCASYVYWLRRS